MGKGNKKLADSVALQLLTLCNGNAPLMTRAQIVQQEFDKARTVDEIEKNQSQLMLNKVLHSTRAMDTSMRNYMELCPLVNTRWAHILLSCGRERMEDSDV